MSLNIKNEEAYLLASELSRLTGQSMTAVVLDALRRRRQQLDQQQKKATQRKELMAIAKRCAAHLHPPLSAVQHGELLYGEDGLPQ